MATFLLSVLIFGSAGAIVYTRLKSGKNCDDCQTACPVKGTDQATIRSLQESVLPFLLILLEHSKMRESKKRKRKEKCLEKKIVRPRYQQIAVDLAERIVENRYKVGEKIHARSTLASTYNASPETTRKAINVLVDLGIMEVRHGVGHLLLRKKSKRFPIAVSRCTIYPRYKSRNHGECGEAQQDELNHFLNYWISWSIKRSEYIR